MAVKVELFTSDVCSRCVQAREDLRTVIDELGTERFEVCVVNVVENLDRAVQLGVLSTPAIAIDGELMFTGVPSRKRLKATLEQSL